MPELSSDWAKAVTNHRIDRQNGWYPELTSKTLYSGSALV